jgi:hypothetical protein
VESIPAAGASTVFIVRIWFERGSQGDSRRAYVQHVGTGSRRYFLDVGEAIEFIEALSGSKRQADPGPSGVD